MSTGAPIKFDDAVKQYFVTCRKYGWTIQGIVDAYNACDDFEGTISRPAYYQHRADDEQFADDMEKAKGFSKMSRHEQLQDLAEDITFLSRSKLLQVIQKSIVDKVADKMTPTELAKFGQIIASGTQLNQQFNNQINNNLNRPQINITIAGRQTAKSEARVKEVARMIADGREEELTAGYEFDCDRSKE